MKRNWKFTLSIVLGMISLLAMSVLISPSFNMAVVKAQGENQSTTSNNSQQVSKSLMSWHKNLEEWSIAQEQTSRCHRVVIFQKDCKRLQIQLSSKTCHSNYRQQMSQLGVNGSNIRNLEQERGGADFSGLVQKFEPQTEPLKCQRGALIGYGGVVFGLADVCTNGHRIDVDIATNYMPQSGKVFEAWLVDDAFEGSGYALSLGKILATGTLDFREVMNNAMTYTDIVITQEPDNDPSPLASWSNSVAETWLIPPFGQ